MEKSVNRAAFGLFEVRDPRAEESASQKVAATAGGTCGEAPGAVHFFCQIWRKE